MRKGTPSTAVAAAIVLTIGLCLAAYSPAHGQEGDGPTRSLWQGKVAADLEAAEYRVTWQTATVIPGLDAAYHAPNRAQGLRAYFVPEGIRVVPRSEEEPTWEWSLSLTAAGRRGGAIAVAPATLRPDGARIDYDRDGISEWYVNDARGLEQAFRIATPPGDGRERREDVVLELALGGTLSAYPTEDGQAIDFRTASGARAVSYADLVVTDAAGRPLPSRMEAFAVDGVRGIRLVFDDRDAVYPVTVDPLATSPAWTAESNQASADFGVSVATAGDVNGDGYSDVVVGAYLYDNGSTNEGAAFLYLGSASGLSSTASWTAEGNQASSRFGFSVATAGDVNGDGYSDVIVGAYGYDNGHTDEGKAWVYLGSAAGLAAASAWTTEANQTTALYGVAVGTAGDVNGDGYSDVVVAAQLYDGGESDEGGAFVYLGSATGLATTANYILQANEVGAQLGVSAAAAGDVNGDGYDDVIVGELLWGPLDQGAIIVFYGSSAGITGSGRAINGTEADSRFGNCVATAGDVNGDGYSDVVAGAYHHTNGQTEEGKAVVYLGSATGITTTPAWTVESDQANALYGLSVSTAGDVNGDGYADVVVGGVRYDAGQVDEGKAFLYLGSAAGLSTTAAWTAESNQIGAEFATSVATAGDVNGDGYSDVLVGAPLLDNGQADEGRVFLYLGSASALSASPPWAQSGQPLDELGTSVSGAGDVNGDGYADVIVGARRYDNGQTDEGRALVYLGSAAGLATTAAWTVESNQASALLGSSVSTAGDVNGDGFSDVVVGAPLFDDGEIDEGMTFVYLGSPTGPGATPTWTAGGNQAGARFGGSVATAGDVNGDGRSDVLVGALFHDNGQSDEGRAFAYLGSPAGLGATPSWTAESDQAASYFGTVGTAGDVNGDGFSDVIVGASSYDNGQDEEGRAYVYLGSAAGLAATPAWTVEGNADQAELGSAVGTAGDVNGDGYADVIVGAPGWYNFELYEGKADVYLGSASGLSTIRAWTAEGNSETAHFGFAAGCAGDVNGDGYSDVIVGAYGYDGSAGGEGASYVYLGSASGLGAAAAWTSVGDPAAQLGYSIAAAGDVNGDGDSDVIVGSSNGGARVYMGNDGGRSIRPQQRRSDDTALVSRLGASDSQTGFRLASVGRTPFGRSKVKLEREVKLFGTAFNGSGTAISAGWTDTGVAGVALNEAAQGLGAGMLHHWRVRLHYETAGSPFQQRSRWFTVPWGGWQEGMLRTAPEAIVASGRVPDGSLQVGKAPSSQITLTWGASCAGSDVDYEIYEGAIGGLFDSHTAILCSTGGATTEALLPSAGSAYYLVVPTSGLREGSYGVTSAGAERPRGVVACLPQQIAACP
jgi:hypothetical protein